jgi:hypothetical protein
MHGSGRAELLPVTLTPYFASSAKPNNENPAATHSQILHPWKEKQMHDHKFTAQ